MSETLDYKLAKIERNEKVISMFGDFIQLNATFLRWRLGCMASPRGRCHCHQALRTSIGSRRMSVPSNSNRSKA